MSHSSLVTDSASVSSEPIQEEPIPLVSSVVHKFYEPIILYVSLIAGLREIAVSVSSEESIDIKDPKQVFQAFVNKLGHVCDSVRGGTTVTSFVVLYDELIANKIHYWFGSNKRINVELEDTAAFVRRLLRKVRQASTQPDQQDVVRKDMLFNVLRFNRPRISFYLQSLQSRVTECIRRCNMDETNENRLIAKELADILDPINTGAALQDSEADYIRKCETTIRILIRIEQSPGGSIIAERAAEGRMLGQSSIECWSELLHTIRRILAYPQSVKFLLLAKERWPQLFDNPHVSFVPSSESIRKPVRNKSLTAEGIVGRMTRKSKHMDIFKNFVKTLQAFNLDERIVTEYKKDTFDPIVHSEVLLLNWLKYNGGIESTRFFNGWIYIGSSKPTCKLCNYFLDNSPEVEHRPGHGNLYPSWRVPDVFPSQGQSALDERQIMVDRLLQRVRKDAFDIVRKKVAPSHKDEDSNTISARLTLEENWTLAYARSDVDGITSLLDQVDLD